jgi:hypothetical protein
LLDYVNAGDPLITAISGACATNRFGAMAMRSHHASLYRGDPVVGFGKVVVLRKADLRSAAKTFRGNDAPEYILKARFRRV